MAHASAVSDSSAPVGSQSKTTPAQSAQLEKGLEQAKELLFEDANAEKAIPILLKLKKQFLGNPAILAYLTAAYQKRGIQLTVNGTKSKSLDAFTQAKYYQMRFESWHRSNNTLPESQLLALSTYYLAMDDASAKQLLPAALANQDQYSPSQKKELLFWSGIITYSDFSTLDPDERLKSIKLAETYFKLALEIPAATNTGSDRYIQYLCYTYRGRTKEEIGKMATDGDTKLFYFKEALSNYQAATGLSARPRHACESWKTLLADEEYKIVSRGSPTTDSPKICRPFKVFNPQIEVIIDD